MVVDEAEVRVDDEVDDEVDEVVVVSELEPQTTFAAQSQTLI